MLYFWTTHGKPRIYDGVNILHASALKIITTYTPLMCNVGKIKCAEWALAGRFFSAPPVFIDADIFAPTWHSGLLRNKLDIKNTCEVYTKIP